jgi:carotenoid cleavage dioxygenase-like enzyme
MTTISKKRAWAGAIAKPATEFPLTPLPVISGKIPSGLRGTLYRNGPARFERGNQRMGHWFDGDGAILAVHFTDAGATAVYRYVQTTGYKQEATADKLLYGNYGMTAPGAFWNQLLRPVKNTANTSVIALPNKLLALWEAGKPYALDLQTLETWGEDDLGGLNQGLNYSAHYKRDHQTGEIFNFGITPGLNAKLHIYKSDFTGKIIQKSVYILDGIPIVHDFVLAGQYLVFCIPPVRLNFLPVLLGKNYSDALEWQPQLGTEILVFDRQTLSLVSCSQAEPWFQWHFVNGYLDVSGSLIIDIAPYKDFQVNQYFQEVPTGETHTPAQSTLSRIHLQPQTGKVTNIETIVDRHCELPTVTPQNVGQLSRYIYFGSWKPGTEMGTELLNAIARFDYQTETLTETNFPENFYTSEPLPVKDTENPEQTWILTVVYDGNSHCSEVWVLDSDRLDAEPVCKLRLPNVIPPSFHGTWKSA